MSISKNKKKSPSRKRPPRRGPPPESAQSAIRGIREYIDEKISLSDAATKIAVRAIEEKMEKRLASLVRNPLGCRVVLSGVMKREQTSKLLEVDESTTVQATETKELETPKRFFFGACGEIPYLGVTTLTVQCRWFMLEDLVLLVPTRDVVIANVSISNQNVTDAQGKSDRYWGIGLRRMALEGHVVGPSDTMRVTLLHEPAGEF